MVSPQDTDAEVARQRAANLWEPLTRKFPPLAKAARFAAVPERDFDAIGGLAEPKEEVLTYACAATNPEVYERWGTAPPTGLLLIGPAECGKTLLAEALARNTGTPFLAVGIPRLVLQLLHSTSTAGPLLAAWLETLREMPRITLLFREVDFSHVESMFGRRTNVPVEPIMDFVLELIDETIAVPTTQVVGSTSHAATVNPAFLEPGRFERVVSVQPIVPDDIVAALEIHAAEAEARAGRPLFESVDWRQVVREGKRPSIGEWVRLLHATLRRKARCETAEENPGLVTTKELLTEVERQRRTSERLPIRRGAYL